MKPKTCMLRYFRMWKMPTFSFCPRTLEVTSGVLPPDNYESKIVDWKANRTNVEV